MAYRHVIEPSRPEYLNPPDSVSANTTAGSRMDHPWALEPHQILGHFQVDPTTGLSRYQVEKHTETYGANGSCPLISIYDTKEN